MKTRITPAFRKELRREIRDFHRYWLPRALGKAVESIRKRKCPQCQRSLALKAFYDRSDGCLDNVCRQCRRRKSARSYREGVKHSKQLDLSSDTTP